MRKLIFLKTLLVVFGLANGSASAWATYSGVGTFTKITSLEGLTDGYYVIVNRDDAFAMNNANAANYFGVTAISPSNGSITDPSVEIVWEIKQHQDGGRTIFNEASNKYVSYSGSANGAFAVSAVSSGSERWTFSYSSNLFSVENVATTGRMLQYYGTTPRFSCYTSAQQKLLLYKMEPLSCTPPNFAFATATVDKLTSDAAFTQTVASLNGTTPIAYSSSNPDVATVNELTGEVTIVGAGSSVITAAQAAGTHNSVDYCAGKATYVVNVASVLPTISVDEASVPAMNATVGSAVSKTITISGTNLTGDIALEISGTDASMFTLSQATVSQNSGTVASTAVTVTYTPTVAGSHSATLTLTSPDAVSVTRALAGTASLPNLMPDVIITEVYGGGGNSGAIYKNDFIELYNTTGSSVQIGGWSVQYYSATGTTPTSVFVIPDGESIPSGNYFLIQAAGGTNGTDLPTPDATCSMSLAAAAGKIILYTVNTNQTISNNIASVTGNANFKDYVPYGTTAVPVWGSATGATENTTSASRKLVSGTYQYTGNTGADFEIIAPNPQDSGMLTGVVTTKIVNIHVSGQRIIFIAAPNQLVEIYNAIGQKIAGLTSVDGLNSIPVSAKGVLYVKIGGRVAKVIM
ncbi:MAG TPA: lamin tail domain-containing protein [Paludibacter sp.]|nr:lamin tail domain-containing protein [Paludibacter sp.]